MKNDLYEEGLKIRRSVLGDAYVDNATRDPDPLYKPIQELVTKYCWGEVWARNEIPRKYRSVANLAMLTALNRPHELRTHIIGALNNGLTREEIVEVLLQTGIYCGIPAALDAFRVAKEVFEVN